MENIKVYCRIRKKNNKEKSYSTIQIKKNQLEIEHKTRLKIEYDKVFQEYHTQEDVFQGIKKVIPDVLEGYNNTIFTYGQTGSGKTYTMFGYDVETGETGVWKDKKGMGIIPRSILELFERIREREGIFTIKMSFIEIYLEKLYDLLNPKETNLKIREQNHVVYVENCKEYYVDSFHEIMKYMIQGLKHRNTLKTNMNDYSSRSHCILMLTLEQKQKNKMKISKLILIDLAGSERVSKSQVEGLGLKQVQHINQSLLTLGNVMNGLSSNESFIRYRDSKLTRLLQDSLGGNSKTYLIITISPAYEHIDETVSTLRFGSRAKLIKNKPIINEEMTYEELKRLLDEKEKELQYYKQGGKGGGGAERIEYKQQEDIEDIKERNEFLEKENQELKYDLQQWRVRYNTLEAIIEDMKLKNKALEQEKKKILSEQMYYTDLIADLESKLSSLHQAKDISKEQKTKYKALREQYNRLSKEYYELRQQLDQQHDEVMNYKIKNDKLLLQIQDMKSNAQLEDECQKQLESIQKQLQEKEEETIQLKNRIHNLSYELQLMKKVKEELEKHIHPTNSLELNSQIMDYKHKLSILKKYNKKLKSKEEYYIQLLENRKQHIEILEHSIQKTTHTFLLKEQDYEQKIRTLQENLHELESTIEVLGIRNVSHHNIMKPLQKK